MPAPVERIPWLMRRAAVASITNDTVKSQYPQARADEQPRESFFRYQADALAILQERQPWAMRPTQSWALETDELRRYGTLIPLKGQLPTVDVVDVHQDLTSKTVLQSYAVNFADDKTAQEYRG